MKKTLLLGRAALLLVLAIMWGGDLSAQTTVTIGNGTSSSYFLPYNLLQRWCYAEYIYSSSDINQKEDKDITSIAFYYIGNHNGESFTFDLYMKNDTKSSYSSGTDYAHMSSSDKYYSGTLTLPNSAGWVTITLDNSFNYNHEKNLIVAINRTDKTEGSSGYSTTAGFYTTTNSTTNYSIHYAYSTGDSPYNPATISSSGSVVKGYPNIQITFDDGDSCLSPTDLEAEVTSASTANLSWTTDGEEDKWILEYSTDEDFSVPANITTSDTLTTNSHEITGLTSHTTYYARVKAVCSKDDTSEWSDSVDFTTLYTASIPYKYCFESSDTLECWTLRDLYASSQISTTTAKSGTHSFDFYNNSTERSQYLITPELTGTSNGIHVSLYFKQQLSGPTIQIGYSKEDYLTTSFTWDDAKSSTNNTFIKYEYNCPAGTKFVAIRYNSSNYTHIYVDDIALTVPTYNPSDGNWNSTSSWSNGAVPTSSSDIVISSDITIPSGCSATANTLLVGEGSLKIASGGTLTITNRIDNTIAANLVIEDGGQLITSSTGVAATVQKDITASTAKSGEGWYTIASSVNNPTIASATNLATGTYDLYRFEESEQEKPWENYKAHSSTDFTTLENGRGYLYRNGDDKTLSFTGDLNVGNMSYTITNSGGDFAGFNLIGNPYPHNIYKGAYTAIPNYSGSTLNTGFHTLTNEGAWSTGTDNSTAILPGQGIMVEATKAGTLTILDKTSSSSSKYNNEYIRFTVENAEYSDDAYAWFDKGYGLHKIDHRNPAIPMLYIPQDGEDYSIAIMKDNTEAFGLNFKANTTGSYTLKYKAKGNFDYLHVIDRLTGKDTDMLLDGEYSFVGSTQDDEARFIVKLAYKPNYGSSDETVFAYQSGSEIFVSGEGELQVFDVTGRIVSTETINGVKAVSVPAQGVYVFRLVGENVKTQKIVVR